MRIDEVLRAKPSSEVAVVAPETTVAAVVATLNSRNVGALVVSVDGSSVDGIVSERDVVRHLPEPALMERPVSSIMTSAVRTCQADQDVEDLMALMTEHRIRHVPVVAAGRLVGIISIGDLVKSRISELEFERDQLDHYLHQT